MSKEGIKMYKLQEIVEAILAGEPTKQIARKVRVSKNTVKKYKTMIEGITQSTLVGNNDITTIMSKFIIVREETQNSENFQWLEKNREELKKLITECDNYARVIEVLTDRGFKGSYSALTRYIQKNNINPDKPIYRIESNPGELAQVDFGSIGKIINAKTGKAEKAYIFVITLCYSRRAYYEIVTNQKVETWCNCHIRAFEYFGGVPSIIIPDNLKSAIIKASFTEPEANKSYADLAKHYGFQIDPCLPGFPQHKGKVESNVKYAKRNFIPFRNFNDFEDANSQLVVWNKKADERIHGTTREKPIDLFEQIEKEKLKALPNTFFEISEWKTLKVHRDIHIDCNSH